MQLFGDNSHLNTWTIEKAKEGDRRAQKAIYDALSAKMFPVCLRYMGEREAAEDILQDGFVTLFSKLDTFSGDGSFEGWARKIFVNTALMSLRKNDVLKESDDVEEARSRLVEVGSARIRRGSARSRFVLFRHIRPQGRCAGRYPDTCRCRAAVRNECGRPRPGGSASGDHSGASRAGIKACAEGSGRVRDHFQDGPSRRRCRSSVYSGKY